MKIIIAEIDDIATPGIIHLVFPNIKSSIITMVSGHVTATIIKTATALARIIASHTIGCLIQYRYVNFALQDEQDIAALGFQAPQYGHFIPISSEFNHHSAINPFPRHRRGRWGVFKGI